MNTGHFAMTTTLANPVSRRERRSNELLQRLLDAAVELFARKGFTETTVEDITNAADVGKGTFFNYFPSKEHILAAFGRMQMSKVQAAADEVAETKLPIRDYLIRLAMDATSAPAKKPAIIRAILQANLSSSPVRQAMKEIHASASGLLARIIAEGQKRGEIRRDLDPLVIAQTLRQSLLGSMLLWSLYGDLTLEQRVQNVFDVIWNGISTNPTYLPSALGAGDGTKQ
jgi:AcrR family transcriptional regulator